MRRIVCPILSIILLFGGCQNEQKMNKSKIDVQGHRGARGLMPENTIPAFLKALELGVTTLELDLAVSKDGQLIVSHEPYMGHHIALDSTGQEIAKEDELKYNLYQMTVEEIQKFDVGTKFHPKFPKQKKIKVHKPPFSELVSAVDQYLKDHNRPPVRYNIEIKSEPVSDDEFHPAPPAFSKMVYDFILTNMDKSLVNVQSFDFRILQYYHENYPDIQLAMLIENTLSIDENLADLGFTPEIYSCDYQLLTRESVEYLRSKGMKVIPWTVNEKEDIKKTRL